MSDRGVGRGTPAPVSGRELRIALLCALLVILPAYLATATWGSLQSDDPRSAALAGWTLVTTGTLAFDQDWTAQAIAWPAEGTDGRLYSNRFPGVIALATTAYAGAVAAGAVPDTALDTPFEVPLWPATLVAVVVAFLAAMLTWALFRHVPVPKRAAWAGAAFVALGTPLWSVSASALWTHGATHALLVGVLLSLLGGRQGAAAIFGALAVTFRPHLAVPLLVIAVAQPDWRGRFMVGGGALAGVGLVALYSLWIFGQPLPAAGYRVGGIVQNMPFRSIPGLAENLFKWLFHPLRGVFFFAPVVAIALLGLRPAWREAPRWIRVAALAGLAYALVQTGLMRASGGSYFFGHRTTIEGLVLASPLLLLAVHTWVLERGRLARIATAVVLGFSVTIHAYGAIVDMPPGIKEALRDGHERRGASVAPEPGQGRTFVPASQRRDAPYPVTGIIPRGPSA